MYFGIIIPKGENSMVTTYKKPTKLQKDAFNMLFEKIKQYSPMTLEMMTYNNRVIAYKDLDWDVEHAYSDKLITKAQYDKLRSRVNVIATWIVDMPVKKRNWRQGHL